MGIGSKDHSAAACKHFSRELVNYGLMRRYINAAVLFGTGKTKHVVILVNGSSYCTKGIMTVGKNIWYRELLKP